MAYTKIITIHDRLDNRLKYIMNENKTVDKESKYSSKDMAAEDINYVTCVNCSMIDPHTSMEKTKVRFGKKYSKRQGYHLIQSFKPGEGTADMVHEIGVKWATELFGDRYQFVVTTHLDKDYLHNHVIVNSTSFVDGKQFTNSKEDFKRMMEISNRICREYGLSVIDNPKARKHSKTVPGYIRTNIKKDIDKCKEKSFTWIGFKNLMEMEGYRFTYIDRFPCVISPYCDQPIPFNSLGKKYNPESIEEFIINDVENSRKSKYYSFNYLENNKNKLSGFMRIYYRFLYDVGILPKRKVKQYLSREMRKQCNKLDKISQEVELMAKQNIKSIEDLAALKEVYQSDLDKLVAQRKGIYAKAYKESNLVEKEKLKLDAKSLTPGISDLRNKLKLLKDIESRSNRLNELCEKLEQDKKDKKKSRNDER